MINHLAFDIFDSLLDLEILVHHTSEHYIWKWRVKKYRSAERRYKLPKASDANAINSNLGLTSILRLRCSGCWRIMNYQNAQNTTSFIVSTRPFVCFKLVPSSISLPIRSMQVPLKLIREIQILWNLYQHFRKYRTVTLL
jgi:hypothetical protein